MFFFWHLYFIFLFIIQVLDYNNITTRLSLKLSVGQLQANDRAEMRVHNSTNQSVITWNILISIIPIAFLLIGFRKVDTKRVKFNARSCPCIWSAIAVGLPASTIHSYVDSKSNLNCGSMTSACLACTPKKLASNVSRCFSFPVRDGRP